MNNIQRAIDKQAKLEADAGEALISQYIFIAHLRNQAALARAVIEAATPTVT